MNHGMRAVYVDSSVVVALLLGESGFTKIRRALDQADELLSANLLEAEVYAAASREGIALRDASLFVKPITLLTPDRSLFPELSKILSRQYCRGADAYHLACALYLDPEAADLAFCTADHRQKQVASELGFKTLQ